MATPAVPAPQPNPLALEAEPANPRPMVAPGPIENTDIIEQQQGRGAEGLRPNREQVWQTTSELESANAFFGFRPSQPGAFFRFIDEGLVDLQAQKTGETKLTAEEASKMYPGVKFDSPVFGTVAALRAETARKQNEQRAWIARGQPLGTWDSFTAGATSGLDPLNLALGLAIGGSSFVSRMGGNVAGNLIADLPTYGLKKHEGQDVNISETIFNSVASGVGGTVAFEGIGRGLGFGLKMARSAPGGEMVFSAAERGVGFIQSEVRSAVAPVVERLPDAVRKRLLRSAVLQREAGAVIDISPAAKVINPGAVEGEAVSPLNHPSDKVIFSSTHPDNDSAPTAYGGRKYVDQERIANADAANPDGPADGVVKAGIASPEGKFLDLDSAASAAPDFIAALEAKLGQPLDIPEGATVRDALDQFSDAIDDPKASGDLIKSAAQEQGLDGFHMKDGPADAPTHNSVVVFDDAKVAQTGEAPANRESAAGFSPEEADAASADVQTKERSEFYDPEIAKELEAIISKETTPEQIDALQKNQEAVARTLVDHPDASPELKEQVRLIQEEYKAATRTKEWSKKLAECIMRGMT